MAKDSVPVDSIPEVKHFMAEQERFRQFRQQNLQFFQYLEQLAKDYNEALSAARAACKQQDVSCGPIEKTSVKTTYDADVMYDLYGREAFLELGGTLETVQKRGLNKKRVEFNIESKRIEPEKAELIRKVTSSYAANPEISIPEVK